MAERDMDCGGRPVNSSKSALLGLSLLLIVAPVAAHGGDPSVSAWWHAWSFDPDLMLPLLLTAFLYLRGTRRRHRRRAQAAYSDSHVFFALGLLALFLSLQSPIDALGERSYSMHQIQHLMLRTLAPMLLFLPSPQATLVAGLPSRARVLLANSSRFTALKGLFVSIAHPAPTTALFIASAYVWQYPLYFEVALLSDGVHYLMHVTMLGAGVLFWWRIFDDRPAGTPHGTRVVMIWTATAANILLGAYLTLKGGVLYPIYDKLGRLWIGGELDELLGGIIIWIPGSMMMLASLLVVIHRWGRREERSHRRRSALGPAGLDSTGSVATSQRASSAGRLGMMMGLFSGVIFLGFIALIIVHLAGR